MRNRVIVAPAFATLAVVVLAGCATVGPDYQRPELGLPASYSHAGSAGGTIAERWWELFGDAELDRLVEAALAANQDLAAAAARVEEARALAGVARADRFPHVDARLGGSRTKLSADTATVPPGFDLERDAFRATVGLSFEIDFWGRLARAHEAARAELLASEEGRRNVRLGVVAGVATAWFDLAALDRQLASTRSTVASRQESVRLQRLRVDAGTISELDLSQAEAELAAAEVAVPQLERARRQTENRLAVLLGRVGGELPQPPAIDPARLPVAPPALPSELLARRPDVVAAEQGLVAANARVGVARAALFPSISLTGYTGSESQELSDLLASGTGLWQVAAGLLQPVFQAGKLRRGVEAAQARQQQALAAYAKAVQSGFAEVEDALVARRTGAAERAALARQVAALARARHLAALRYEAGEAAYLEVLDAERALFRAEL
ncbi:MAG: efflux transporter outer membrane subunit, partial [Thermoanaerobaculia bacterium]|nr:efflux transporter outer membrane subunit [Thermoanaerobaculia bacterium]